MAGWHQRCLGFATTQLIAPLFSPPPLWWVSSRPLCILLWLGISERREGPENDSSFYLFISLSISPPLPYCCFCFPKLTNVLELIECDPLTAAWNNEASFPHIFSPPPRTAASLSPALGSTSKCFITVESGAEGIIDHAESPGLRIYCSCTQGEMILPRQKPGFQSVCGFCFGFFFWFVLCHLR